MKLLRWGFVPVVVLDTAGFASAQTIVVVWNNLGEGGSSHFFGKRLLRPGTELALLREATAIPVQKGGQP